jgi:hypothetical protein
MHRHRRSGRRVGRADRRLVQTPPVGGLRLLRTARSAGWRPTNASATRNGRPIRRGGGITLLPARAGRVETSLPTRRLGHQDVSRALPRPPRERSGCRVMTPPDARETRLRQRRNRRCLTSPPSPKRSHRSWQGSSRHPRASGERSAAARDARSVLGEHRVSVRRAYGRLWPGPVARALASRPGVGVVGVDPSRSSSRRAELARDLPQLTFVGRRAAPLRRLLRRRRVLPRSTHIPARARQLTSRVLGDGDLLVVFDGDCDDHLHRRLQPLQPAPGVRRYLVPIAGSSAGYKLMRSEAESGRLPVGHRGAVLGVTYCRLSPRRRCPARRRARRW